MILFDKRGTGLSDRSGGAPDFDMRADDLRAVLDACRIRSSRALRRRGWGEPRRPLRRDAPRSGARARPLQLLGPRHHRHPTTRSASRSKTARSGRPEIEQHWGIEEMREAVHARIDPRRRERPGVDPVGGQDLPSRCLARRGAGLRRCRERRPTSGASWRPCKHRRSCSPAADAGRTRRVCRPRRTHPRSAPCAAPRARIGPPTLAIIDALIDEVERFVRSVSAEEASFDRVLATVLFTDIVGSTQKAADARRYRLEGVARTTSRGRSRDDRPLPGSRDRHHGRWVPRDVRRSRPRRAMRASHHRSVEAA